MLLEGNVNDNTALKSTSNAHQKLSDVEVNEIKKMVNDEKHKCNKTKRLSKDNEFMSWWYFLISTSGCITEWQFHKFELF